MRPWYARPSADLAPRLWDPLSPVACSGRLLLHFPYLMRAPPRSTLVWRTASQASAAACARFISPTAFEQARGGALGAGGGRVGFAGGGLF